MQTFEKIVGFILSAFTLLTLYKTVYTVLGFLGKRLNNPTPPPSKIELERRYGVVICARNEETVISSLIDSIAKQTFPSARLHVFVCADNCTDKTAEICRALGCTVYERQDKTRARKGYALQYLFDCIQRDFGVSTFDGFFFFDADNLLKEDFIATMDGVFDEKRSGVIVGYRSTKNFDTNVISAGYGIHFYKSIMNYHRPRTMLGLNTHIAGTGFLINARLLQNGWKHVGLTEDAELTQELTAMGERIEFCEQAEFYDEQPHNFFVAWRQRLRWSKGRLIAFFVYGHKLLRGLFTQKGLRKKCSCYDVFFYNFPKSLIAAALTAIYPLTEFILSLISGAFFATFDPWGLVWLALKALASSWLSSTLINALVCIRERKRIHCSTSKLIWYTLTAYWFSMISLPVAVCSLLIRVKWKPIKHDDAKKIDDLHKPNK